MIVTRVFQGDLDYESVPELILNLEPILERGDLIKLYLSSHGGDHAAGEMLSEFLEDWNESIILIGFDQLYSAGFNVFFRYSGEKRLTSVTAGMIHEASSDLAIIKLKNPSSPHSVMKQMIEELNEEFLNGIKEKLTVDEVLRFTRGEDVYIATKRFKEICDL